MTDFVVVVDTSRLDAKLRRVPRKVEQAVFRAVTRLSIELQGYVKEFKLSGQVLHNRTGTLRRSINRDAQQAGSKIRGVVGTNVSYGAAWEFGFDRPVGYGARGSLREVSAKFLAKHPPGVRHYEERSFLRSALKDFEPRILERLKSAASGEALR